MINLKDNYRILVIDDIPAIHEDFKKILIPEKTHSDQVDKLKSIVMGSTVKKSSFPPFEVDCASQGAEGIMLAKKALEANRPYAVAFVDIQMPPGLDGVETIEKLWHIDPNIQIVICSAYAKYSWEDLQMRFGDTDSLFLLKKPFENLEIIQLALSLTKKWNINRAVRYQLSVVRQMSSPKKTGLDASISNLKNSVEKLSQLTNSFSTQNQEKKPAIR